MKLSRSSVKQIGKYTLLVFTFSSFFLVNAQYGAASSVRYYCGYYYDSPPPYGVKGNIYTIQYGSIILTATFQSVTVMLSYSPEYWLQVGYKKWWLWLIVFPVPASSFYFERIDSEVNSRPWFGIPANGHTYTYIIKHIDGNQWVWYIKEGSTTLHSGEDYPNPYIPVDLQAFSETTTQRNIITGTHFSYLSKASGSGWDLWDTHYAPPPDPPYVLQQISHYEFKGSGGYG